MPLFYCRTSTFLTSTKLKCHVLLLSLDHNVNKTTSSNQSFILSRIILFYRINSFAITNIYINQRTAIMDIPHNEQLTSLASFDDISYVQASENTTKMSKCKNCKIIIATSSFNMWRHW